MELIQSELTPFLYRKRDSNSQKTDPKSAASAISPFLLLINPQESNLKFVEIVGFEPTQSKTAVFSSSFLLFFWFR